LQFCIRICIIQSFITLQSAANKRDTKTHKKSRNAFIACVLRALKAKSAFRRIITKCLLVADK